MSIINALQLPRWSEAVVHFPQVKPAFSASNAINQKICLWQGDITKLKVDAIVNAANSEVDAVVFEVA